MEGGNMQTMLTVLGFKQDKQVLLSQTNALGVKCTRLDENLKAAGWEDLEETLKCVQNLFLFYHTLS